jgi:hypothetical protein
MSEKEWIFHFSLYHVVQIDYGPEVEFLIWFSVFVFE